MRLKSGKKLGTYDKNTLDDHFPSLNKIKSLSHLLQLHPTYTRATTSQILLSFQVNFFNPIQWWDCDGPPGEGRLSPFGRSDLVVQEPG